MPSLLGSGLANDDKANRSSSMVLRKLRRNQPRRFLTAF